jgi:hypothetical protein
MIKLSVVLLHQIWYSFYCKISVLIGEISSASGGEALWPGVLPWTPLGQSPQTPIIGSRSALAMSVVPHFSNREYAFVLACRAQKL